LAIVSTTFVQNKQRSVEFFLLSFTDRSTETWPTSLGERPRGARQHASAGEYVGALLLNRIALHAPCVLHAYVTSYSSRFFFLNSVIRESKRWACLVLGIENFLPFGFLDRWKLH
jgi:hypothetical protein